MKTLHTSLLQDIENEKTNYGVESSLHFIPFMNTMRNLIQRLKAYNI